MPVCGAMTTQGPMSSDLTLLSSARQGNLQPTAYSLCVNCLCSSWADTLMVQQTMHNVPGPRETIEATVPMGRLARPEEVGDGVIFYAAPHLATSLPGADSSWTEG
ncbi:hypothetical protein F4818DRAFT_427451 [Hypoxylon cercidicola]|nr:hypothetical protein F4818DRAFT_427451 [Hypoxylon cercidicola]